MRIFRILTIGALSALALAFTGPTAAVTTFAQVVAVTGARTAGDLHSASGGAEGAQISAGLVIPSAAGDIFISAEAASIPGALHAAGVTRNGVITARGTQAEAYASWADSFVISALGYDSSMTGTFTGAITVFGGLLARPGRGHSFADASVFGDVSFDPHTGFNSGIVSAHGEARRLAGDGIPETHRGEENFTLSFADVNFTFGQRIDFSTSLFIDASILNGGDGGNARAEADYGHTLTWAGLSEVRDSSGRLLTNYSALSASSGFNFANATPVTEPMSVPEPMSGGLMIAGLVMMMASRFRQRQT